VAKGQGAKKEVCFALRIILKGCQTTSNSQNISWRTNKQMRSHLDKRRNSAISVIELRQYKKTSLLNPKRNY
jgi:hypothetical protein